MNRLEEDPLDDLMAERLVEYEARLAAGQPASAALQTDEADPAEIAARLKRAKACLDLLAELKGAGGVAEVAPTDSSRGGAADETPQIWRDRMARHMELAAQSVGQLFDAHSGVGRFKVLELLGAGGFGVVYRAKDPRTGRDVALKIPRPEALASPELQRRFEQEARAAAKLDHPNLVPVLEAGVDGTLPYIASTYYDGQTLAAWLANHSAAVPPAAAAGLARSLADALSHAHLRGVLHRDIKPSNVLLVARAVADRPISGGPQQKNSDNRVLDLAAATPKLMDFGLAKLIDDAQSLTQSGAMLGTVRYMSPEQASCRTRDIGPASDVYSLGAILYELLTGQPPFGDVSDIEALTRIVHEEPSTIRAARPKTPVDLEIICLKCLQKDPKRRYASALALRDDLDRFLTGRPILARPVSAVENVWKWARRRPALAALLAVCAISLLAGTIGVAAFNVRLRANAQRLAASQKESQDLLHAANMQLAQAALADNATSQVMEYLRRDAEPDEGEDRRDFAWRFLNGILNRNQGELPKHPADVYGVAFSPDGKLLATTCRDGRLRVWKLSARTLLRELADHDGESGAVAFSHDGRLLATGGDDGRIVIRDVDKLDQTRVLAHPAPDGYTDPWEISGLVFAPDDKRLFVAAGRDLYAWRLDDGELLAHRPRAHEDWFIRSMSMSADGEMIVTYKYEVKFWRTADLTPLDELNARWSDLNTFGRSGASFVGRPGQILLADKTGGLLLLDVRNPQEKPQLPSRHTQVAKTFDATLDGRLIVTGSVDGTVQSICLPKSNVLQRKHVGRVWCVAIAPDGLSYVSGGEDGQVLFWDVQRDQRSDDIRGVASLCRIPKGDFAAVTDSPDGRFLAGMSGSGISVIDRWTDQRIQLQNGRSLCACFTQDSQRLISGNDAGQVSLWDLRTKQRLTEHNDLPNIVAIALSANNDRLVVANRTDQSVNVYAWPEFRKLFTLPNSAQVHAARFDAESRSIVVARVSELARFDAETGAEIWRIVDKNASFHDIDFLDDGKTLLLAEYRQGVALRELATGRLISRITSHPGPVVGVASAPDNRNFASICDNEHLRVWDRKTLQPVLKFAHQKPPQRGGLRFSRASDRLYAVDLWFLTELPAPHVPRAPLPVPDWTWSSAEADGPPPPRKE